ncbi:hypothetical protein [Catenulispora pinisilvae]|uniref:hypothetical protein n=1 Tax=Catenulispora pinisilvae TaxID=2705253 RepID=UPI001890E630|nr:hypothetical protein [Catenulispora pinisilvae]
MSAMPPGSHGTAVPGRETADLLAFLDFACHAGLLSSSSTAAYRLGARRILSALPEQATADLTVLLDDRAIAVFNATSGETISEATRRQYAASFRKALMLFRDYLKQPQRWHDKAAENGNAPGWTPTADGGVDLTIPLPRARAMRVHLPADVTANDARLAKRVLSSYLAEIAPAATTNGED